MDSLYDDIDSLNSQELVGLARSGIKASMFRILLERMSFTLKDWGRVLHFSDEELQRFLASNSIMDPFRSERVLQIIIFYKKGVDAFSSKEMLIQWLKTPNNYFNGTSPINLLDSSFGVVALNDALTQIDFGVIT